MNAEQHDNSKAVAVQQLEPQAVLIIRDTALVSQLGETMGDRIQALSSYIQQHGAQPAGAPFVRYHTFGETETDFELGVPMAEPVDGEGRVTRSELPGGPAISTWHLGPHDKLGDAYARLNGWLKEHDREPSSPAWEVYHWLDLSPKDDPSAAPAMPDPSGWRTQLVQSIK